MVGCGARAEAMIDIEAAHSERCQFIKYRAGPRCPKPHYCGRCSTSATSRRTRLGTLTDEQRLDVVLKTRFHRASAAGLLELQSILAEDAAAQ